MGESVTYEELSPKKQAELGVLQKTLRFKFIKTSAKFMVMLFVMLAILNIINALFMDSVGFAIVGTAVSFILAFANFKHQADDDMRFARAEIKKIIDAEDTEGLN